MRQIIFDELTKETHGNAKNKGFWDDVKHPGVLVALMHSELSEALEAIRDAEDEVNLKGLKPSKKAEGYSNLEEEFADVIIRILDFAGHYDLDIGGAVLEKMRYNSGRPHLHGRKF